MVLRRRAGCHSYPRSGKHTTSLPPPGGTSFGSLQKTTGRTSCSRKVRNTRWSREPRPTLALTPGKALIFPIGQQVVSSYSRRPFFGFYEAESDFPPLPTEKHLALDAIHFTAEKFSLDLELQVGDLEYANNLTVFHGACMTPSCPWRSRTVPLTRSSYLFGRLGNEPATPRASAPGAQGPAAACGRERGFRQDQCGRGR